MTEKHFSDRDFETGESPEESQGSPASRRGGGFLEFLIIVLIAFAVVFGIVRPFILEAFYIPSSSMVPTLRVGERVFVNKFIYHFREPEKGDIVVFRSVEGDDEDLIKRVVALPGDEISDQDGVIYVNGEPQEEPFVNQRSPDHDFYGPTKVPEGEVFVMGDNRSNSADSRVFGPVPIENIEGEAFVSFWPPSRIGLL